MRSIRILVAILLCAPLATAQTKNFIDQPYLETTAQVDSLVVPDIIYLNIELRESDEKGRVSLEALENKMATTLRSLGIDLERQLSINDLDSDFHKYFLRKKDILKSKAYRLKVFDGQTAGRVVQRLEAVGIANVNLGGTQYSKIKELRLALKSLAVAKAKEQAQYLTQPLGQVAGKALYINDRFYQAPVYRGRSYQLEAVTAQQDSYEPLPLEFGPIRVQSEVAVKFLLE